MYFPRAWAAMNNVTSCGFKSCVSYSSMITVRSRRRLFDWSALQKEAAALVLNVLRFYVEILWLFSHLASVDSRPQLRACAQNPSESFKISPTHSIAALRTSSNGTTANQSKCSQGEKKYFFFFEKVFFGQLLLYFGSISDAHEVHFCPRIKSNVHCI